MKMYSNRPKEPTAYTEIQIANLMAESLGRENIVLKMQLYDAKAKLAQVLDELEPEQCGRCYGYFEDVFEDEVVGCDDWCQGCIDDWVEERRGGGV